MPSWPQLKLLSRDADDCFNDTGNAVIEIGIETQVALVTAWGVYPFVDHVDHVDLPLALFLLTNSKRLSFAFDVNDIERFGGLKNDRLLDFFTRLHIGQCENFWADLE